MRADELPDAQLQEAIAVAKVRAVWGRRVWAPCRGAVRGRRVGIGGRWRAWYPPPRRHPPRLYPPKVRAVETVIQLCFRLKQAVGSHALMVGSGFEHLDSMQAA